MRFSSTRAASSIPAYISGSAIACVLGLCLLVSSIPSMMGKGAGARSVELVELTKAQKQAKLHSLVHGMDNYFHPLGKAGKHLTVTQRFKILEGEKGSKKGNNKWQHWMDVQFGHTQDQVAARRLPSSSTLKGANGKNKPQSLVDKLTSSSWVNTAEVDGGVHHKRVQRFVDSLK